MITEQDKQAILNGAYGITREGTKVKYIGKRELIEEFNEYPYFFVNISQNDKIIGSLFLSKNLTYYLGNESVHDVVGLWVDKPEPFNLEKALTGEPVMLRNGLKAIILKQIKDTLIGYFDKCSPFAWETNGDASPYADSNHDIIAMWKEPEPVKNTVTLPRPLKEPKDGMWYINECGPFESYYHGKDMNLNIFNKRVYFGSKADAQACGLTLCRITADKPPSAVLLF